MHHHTDCCIHRWLTWFQPSITSYHPSQCESSGNVRRMCDLCVVWGVCPAHVSAGSGPHPQGSATSHIHTDGCWWGLHTVLSETRHLRRNHSEEQSHKTSLTWITNTCWFVFGEFTDGYRPAAVFYTVDSIIWSFHGNIYNQVLLGDVFMLSLSASGREDWWRFCQWEHLNTFRISIFNSAPTAWPLTPPSESRWAHRFILAT